jgi:peptidoglycan/xylan/chitin deacetylase (PgdA/CDA1 family)
MRRLLPPLLFLLPALGAPLASVNAQSQAPLPEPVLAEAPAAAPELTAAAPAETPAETPVPASAPASAPSKISYSSCTVDAQVLAITFDDGPHPQNTPRLLDILKQRGIKATFFVVGQNALEYPDLLKRIAAEGHELANHSFSHPILASLGESALRDQLDKTHQAVLNATGVTMKVMRPPYGALSQPQRAWTHSNFGYRIILWDVDPLDWKFRDASRVETEILAHAKAGSIILSHDIHKTTVDAMPSTLDALAAKGFKFLTVSELLALDRPAPSKTSAAPKPTAKTAPKPAPAADSKPSDKASKENTAARSNVAAAKSEKSASSNANTTAAGESSKNNSSPKTGQPSQEDLRKKWLQSMNQR